MSTDWLSEQEARAWRGFRRMNTLMPPRIERDLQLDAGLSDADYEVLSNLSEQGDHRYRLKDLSARLLWSRSRLSHHLTRMEARDLVRRVDYEHDARGAVVVLTDDGLAAIRSAAPGHVLSVRRHFIDLLSAEELAMLGEIADRVVARLEADM